MLHFNAMMMISVLH